MNKAIRAAYERAWRELRERAQRARDGSLTQRWLDDYAKAVHARAQELSSAVNDTVTGGMRTAAGAAAKATEDWLDLVGLRAGIDRSFTGTLSQASDEAMRAVVTGRAYLDGKRLSQRIWNAAGRLEGGINSVLEQGIAQKKSAYQIAKDLAAFVNPDAWEDYDWHKVYPDLPSWLSKGWTNVEKHAQRVARTSINHAYHIAMKESAARNPFATAIHWELSPSHWERQVKPFGADICDEYAAHDEGLGVGNWPIDGVPLPHPQCLCSQWAVTPDDLDACAQRLRRWLDGGEDASMDAAFAQWRQELQAGENDAIIELTRDDAAQRRAAAMESIAAREDVQGMSTTERQRYFAALADYSSANLERIVHGKLPDAGTVVIPDGKLSYVLVYDPNKARRFREKLGFVDGDQQLLYAEVERHLRNEEYRLTISKNTDAYGSRYASIMQMTGKDGQRADVCVSWILSRENPGELRMTSCYIEE